MPSSDDSAGLRSQEPDATDPNEVKQDPESEGFSAALPSHPGLPTPPKTISSEEFERLLGRRRRLDTLAGHVPVATLFRQLLRIAARFVPAESGWILLDDPAIKVSHPLTPEHNELVLAAAFGPDAESLVGRRRAAGLGSAGRTYLSGQALRVTVGEAALDPTRPLAPPDGPRSSTISVPVLIERSICGVLQLCDRRDGRPFDERDLEVLTVVAGYISTTLQNVLDGNRYRELSKRDDLTGLFNDRYFNQFLAEEIDRAEQNATDIGLIFIDLDHFKSINDRHGHLVGSQTLREVGLILRGSTTPEDAFVARYGGDEFVVVLPHSGIEEATDVAEAIRERIALSAFRLDQDVDGSHVLLVSGSLTASIGVTSYRSLGANLTGPLKKRKNVLIRSADQAMYSAKSQGKNRVCLGVYESSDDTIVIERREHSPD